MDSNNAYTRYYNYLKKEYSKIGKDFTKEKYAKILKYSNNSSKRRNKSIRIEAFLKHVDVNVKELPSRTPKVVFKGRKSILRSNTFMSKLVKSPIFVKTVCKESKFKDNETPKSSKASSDNIELQRGSSKSPTIVPLRWGIGNNGLDSTKSPLRRLLRKVSNKENRAEATPDSLPRNWLGKTRKYDISKPTDVSTAVRTNSPCASRTWLYKRGNTNNAKNGTTCVESNICQNGLEVGKNGIKNYTTREKGISLDVLGKTSERVGDSHSGSTDKKDHLVVVSPHETNIRKFNDVTIQLTKIPHQTDAKLTTAVTSGEKAIEDYGGSQSSGIRSQYADIPPAGINLPESTGRIPSKSLPRYVFKKSAERKEMRYLNPSCSISTTKDTKTNSMNIQISVSNKAGNPPTKSSASNPLCASTARTIKSQNNRNLPDHQASNEVKSNDVRKPGTKCKTSLNCKLMRDPPVKMDTSVAKSTQHREFSKPTIGKRVYLNTGR